MKAKAVCTTENLSNLLKTVRHSSDAQGQLDDIKAGYQHYEREYKRIREENSNEAYNCAHSFHLLIDEEISKHRANHPNVSTKICCKAGCSHCCEVNVDITDDEAELLVEWTRAEKIPIDWEHVKRQASKSGDEWRKAASREQRVCPMLDTKTGSCRVYEVRPGACRVHFSADDRGSSACDLNNYGEQIKKFVSPMSEIILSAMYNARKRGGPMAKMLLAAKERVDARRKLKEERNKKSSGVVQKESLSGTDQESISST